MADIYVLDTSAILAFLLDEAGAARVAALLTAADKGTAHLYLSFATLIELYYITWQEKGESAAKELIALVKSLPVEIIDSNEKICLLAGRIKAGHRLSFADACIAATAQALHGALVHKDPEFDPLKSTMAMEALPYKTSR